MRLLFSLAVITMSINSVAYADSCFCKILCFWAGGDSSDFYKVEDVSCELAVEKQKELVKPKLIKHLREKPRGFDERDVSSKTEIMCYRTKMTAKPKVP